MLIPNKQAVTCAYPSQLQSLMNIASANQDRLWLSAWDGLAPAPTPLFALPDLAQQLKLASINVKDEGKRSALGSFKVLGAPIALVRLILRLWPQHQLQPQALLSGQYRSLLQDFTVISATDGNHGRALAAAARSIGCRCEIVLHAHVSEERAQAIAACGANITRIAGGYDDSVAAAAHLAELNGWQVVADTSYPGYETVPRDVMQGYGTLVAEIMEQSASAPGMPLAFTHVFLQGGVGGLAAGVVSYLWEYYGERRPHMVVVEPVQADCLYQSALQGQAAKASGSVDSVMAGLACGETSALAWQFLAPAVDHFMTISDDDAVNAMQVLARGSVADVPVLAGESGAAGLAGLRVLCQDAALSQAVGLGAAARILLINTEADTAPGVYAQLVGESGAAVLARQTAWLAGSATRASSAK